MWYLKCLFSIFVNNVAYTILIIFILLTNTSFKGPTSCASNCSKTPRPTPAVFPDVERCTLLPIDANGGCSIWFQRTEAISLGKSSVEMAVNLNSHTRLNVLSCGRHFRRLGKANPVCYNAVVGNSVTRIEAITPGDRELESRLRALGYLDENKGPLP